MHSDSMALAPWLTSSTSSSPWIVKNRTDSDASKSDEFSKEEYTAIVREKRRMFVQEHFGKKLSPLFNNLREDAAAKKPCHREFSLDMPEHFDTGTIEAIVTAYFGDLGYKVLTEPRKEPSTKLTFTLT